MNENPLASIAIITYNQEQYIRQTLDAAVNQRCDFDFEIVVGEDASTDNTRNIILAYQRQYPHLIRLIPAAPNKGLLVNFGDTLASCKGKYIGICAGDDFWHNPFKLQNQVNFLESNPEYGVVHTDANVYHEADGSTIENYNAKNQPGMIDGEIFEALLTSQFFIIPITACLRRSLFEQYVDFSEFKRQGFIYEDLPTWLELARHTKFKHLPESMATYRVIENSVSRPADVKKKFAFMQAHYQVKKYYIDRYEVAPEIVRQFEITYHQRRFNLAYNCQEVAEAEASYRFLKSEGEATGRLWLKKLLLNLPILHRSFKKFKNISLSKASPALLKKAKT